MEMDGQQVSPQLGSKRKGGSGEDHMTHIEDSIQTSSKKSRTYDEVDDRLLHPFGGETFEPRYRKVDLHLRPMNTEPHYGSNVEVDLTGHVAVQLEESMHNMNSQHHQSVHMSSNHEGIQDDSKVNDAGGFISSDNDVGPVAQPVTPEMGHDHHSGKRNREERRSKDKAVVRNFVCMMTDETDEVQKNIPTHMHEQVGIEKNKLWDMFVRFITLPGNRLWHLKSEELQEITPSVFWKYTYGKSRWNNSMEAPVYSNPDFHKEVLKAGVKRLSGVRWRDPSHPPDIDKIRYHNDELLKVGYQLDMESIFKELQMLLKDHDSKKPKLNRPTSHRYIKKPIHQHQQDLSAMSIVTQSDAGISSGMQATLTPIHQATPIDLMTAQQAQHLIDLMTNYIHALHQFLSLQGKPNGNNL